jgi:hypothetical protein
VVPLEVVWGLVSQAQVAPVRVVLRLDAAEHLEARLQFSFPDSAIDQFTLKASEEAIGPGVVVGIVYAAHRWAHTHEHAPRAELHDSLLTALSQWWITARGCRVM